MFQGRRFNERGGGGGRKGGVKIHYLTLVSFFFYSLDWIHIHSPLFLFRSLCGFSHQSLWLPSSFHGRVPDMRSQLNSSFICQKLDSPVRLLRCSRHWRRLCVSFKCSHRQKMLRQTAVYRAWNRLNWSRSRYHGSQSSPSSAYHWCSLEKYIANCCRIVVCKQFLCYFVWSQDGNCKQQWRCWTEAAVQTRHIPLLDMEGSRFSCGYGHLFLFYVWALRYIRAFGKYIF